MRMKIEGLTFQMVTHFQLVMQNKNIPMKYSNFKQGLTWLAILYILLIARRLLGLTFCLCFDSYLYLFAIIGFVAMAEPEFQI